jgi:hypothetical protein
MKSTKCRAYTTKNTRQNIAAFQLVGYSVWNGEVASSSLACYTLNGGISLTGKAPHCE